MKVYKFGGASVASAEGVRNLASIVSEEAGRLLVIVSAMGKTTNALENALECFIGGNPSEAVGRLRAVREYHACIMDGLWGADSAERMAAGRSVDALWDELERLLGSSEPGLKSYDEWYDAVVSYGELVSTAIVHAWLSETAEGGCRRFDMRRLFVTDSRHRDADGSTKLSEPRLRKAVEETDTRIMVGQGFIGADASGVTTTLGREGSDYSAAVAAYMLDAENVTIWKDVSGILNADPKLFPDARHIPVLGYLDAIELAHSGAQVIHPKTIKPLQNKNIPLYVKCFSDPSLPGSTICGGDVERTSLPVIILKREQVLLTLRPGDFSFVLGEKLSDAFSMLEKHRIKINLIQSSAVSLSLCIDASRNLEPLVEELMEKGFHAGWNTSMELLTIRGYTPEQDELYAEAEGVYMVQRTRRSLRIVRKSAK